jgi:RimJ/RimL family protein N-acetyltransferase
MDEWQPRDLFVNALGYRFQAHRSFRNKLAFAVLDPSDAPVAVAGEYDTAGLSEIGVDVLPAHRGRGLSAIVTAAAARAILNAGGTAYYTCEVRNIRSQHTALAAGFMPACTVSLVMPRGIGVADSLV